jgi:1-deoxy-D-xylulose-5-phosphate synthase
MTGLAGNDSRIVAITAAMKEGTGLECFAEKFPDRLFDVGIAEQHAVTFAAGLAVQGLRPVVAVYSTFLQRAYDQIVHDVCLQNLPVIFAIDRSGFVGEDGPTHHGAFDISFLRHIPNLSLLVPKNTEELCLMLKWAVQQNSPVAIRYPRGKAPETGISGQEVLAGKAEILRQGKDIIILAAGTTALNALKAADRLHDAGISAAVVNARFVKPLDLSTISDLAVKTPRILTVEENALQGGFGSAVIECLNDAGLMNIEVRRLGIPDAFIEQANINSLRKKYMLDEDGIFSAAYDLFRDRATR